MKVESIQTKLLVAFFVICVLVVLLYFFKDVFKNNIGAFGRAKNYSKMECISFYVLSESILAAKRSTGHRFGDTELYLSYDLGESWQRMEAPNQVLKITGIGKEWYLLTAQNEIFKSNDHGKTWTLLPFQYEKPGLIYTGNYLQDIEHDQEGNLFVCGQQSLYQIDGEGDVIRKWTVENPKIDAFDTVFLAQINVLNNKMVVLGNPFKNYLVPKEGKFLIEWNEGINERNQGLFGVSNIIHLSDRYILMSHDGLYSKGISEDNWRCFRKVDFVPNMPRSINRDLIITPWNDNQWILANDFGIFLMESEDEVEILWKENWQKNKFGLIGNLVSINGAIYASFIKSKENIIGVKIADQADHIELIKLKFDVD
jgi:hypothetical protein